MATPYAHSFCDKFLGALRHTTPSILRQRGSAATIYENGTTLVESLNKDDSGMSKKNATSYANTIYFDGETGTRYRVEVSAFAEDAGGDSDSRSKT